MPREGVDASLRVLSKSTRKNQAGKYKVGSSSTQALHFETQWYLCNTEDMPGYALPTSMHAPVVWTNTIAITEISNCLGHLGRLVLRVT
jgi:hypothetical protein